MKIITVSREFGSGGRELGKRLADELGFAYYDKEIITAIAEEEGLYYLDTASVMKDSSGFLLPEFDVGDGHHLTREAYVKMLEYLRTHGVKK